MLSSLTNLYPVSKTLQFSLLPIGKTEENFNLKNLLYEDEVRAKNYTVVKGIIDLYHKSFIERILSRLDLEGISEYAELYYKSGKSPAETKKLEKVEEGFRKEIAKAFSSDPEYNSLFDKDLIDVILPAFVSTKEEMALVQSFKGFTTYFTNFHQNRKNMYTEKPQTTAISYRCINENLPKYLDNCRNFNRVWEALSAKARDDLSATYSSLYGFDLTELFRPTGFSRTLAQSGIDCYNCILGGYTNDDKSKVKGINEHINLFNQQNAGKDHSLRLPQLKPLFKQILSDRDTVSFIPEQFRSDTELLEAIYSLYIGRDGENDALNFSLIQLRDLFSNLSSYDPTGIYLKSGGPITDLSNNAFGSWNVIVSAWNAEYERTKPMKAGKDPEKYYDEERTAYKKNLSFSLEKLERLGNSYQEESISLTAFYSSKAKELLHNIFSAFSNAEALLSQPYNNEKKLSANDEAIEQIKILLDSLKALESFLKPLLGTGKEENRDAFFYGRFEPLLANLNSIDRLYDKVRNYLTQKPYSLDKIKLNFNSPQLLNGWDRNKETDYRCVLLMKEEKYYLGIMDKTNPRVFENIPDCEENEPCYQKIVYKLLPGPNKMLPKVFFAPKNVEDYSPDSEIWRIKESESFKKGEQFNLQDCHRLIDFYKASIQKHPDWSKFNFQFSDTTSYRDISDFFTEVKNQGYKINTVEVPESYVNEMIDSGELFLFQLYNKDFSEYSKGTPNMHTLYWRMLFDSKNLADVVFKLNGEAEMFYRKESIRSKERIVHPANQPIKNRNPKSAKQSSLFSYDLIKDFRFTKRQFSLHVPITINFQSANRTMLDMEIRKLIRQTPNQHIIGIDRGERNLIYISVINGKGEIVEQKSLNEIIGDNGYRVDYHDLLERKEEARKNARLNWSSIENIKELKAGYMSQVIHEICKLVIKYDAVIALEDLNSGFKNSRAKVEKQVYQKFEKMLIDKLNYLADKKADPDSIGGLLHAYQLTNPSGNSKYALQNGIIFYVPAWLTSKIDPTTGFVNLFDTRYSNVQAAQSFFGAFDCISYNDHDQLFEFEADYSKFPKGSIDSRRKWTICTNGSRIETFRNPEKNNEWDNREICLTEEYKMLFASAKIDCTHDLQAQILSQASADFFRKLLHLFSLTVQMRNSVTGSDIDYLISPVRNETGVFFDTRNGDETLPLDADANGAYNIARKCAWALKAIRETDDDNLAKVKLAISKKDWLAYTQTNE